MNAIEFFVPGRLRPKGSWKPITIGGRTSLIPDNKRSAPWAKAVAIFARVRMTGDPWDRPVGIRIRFMFKRPKSHLGKTGLTKPGREMPFPIGDRNYPDLDKLERNVWDALTGIVWRDDVLVVQNQAGKEWSDDEGALVTVWKI